MVSEMQLVICTHFFPTAKFVNVLKLLRRIARLSKNMLESFRTEQIWKGVMRLLSRHSSQSISCKGLILFYLPGVRQRHTFLTITCSKRSITFIIYNYSGSLKSIVLIQVVRSCSDLQHLPKEENFCMFLGRIKPSKTHNNFDANQFTCSRKWAVDQWNKVFEMQFVYSETTTNLEI